MNIVESTNELRNNINAVDGFDPNVLLTQYVSEDGSSVLRLNFEGANAWFKLKYPNGYGELSALILDKERAVFQAMLYSEPGVRIGLPGIGQCENGQNSEINKNYILSAATMAYNSAFRYACFGTPSNAHVIEGVTSVVSAAVNTEVPVDMGVNVSRLVPAMPSTKKTGDISDVQDAQPVTAPPVKQASNIKTYEDALAYTFKSGANAGKTMKELQEEKGPKYVAYFLNPKYEGSDVGIAARLIAAQEGF